MRIGGLFNGTGADVTICIGFVPDWVNLWNLTGTTRIAVEWNAGMLRDISTCEGILGTGAGTFAKMAIGAGIQPFYGGTVLSATTAGTTTYGEGVYLKRDDWDYRYVDANHSPGDAISNDIDKWTLDTAGNYSGHFNADVTGTYIGEGSMIKIDGRWYAITTLTAAQGIASDEVVLTLGPLSGVVQQITGKFGYKPMIANEVTKEGFLVGNATLNVNNETIVFEAGTYR